MYFKPDWCWLCIGYICCIYMQHAAYCSMDMYRLFIWFDTMCYICTVLLPSLASVHIYVMLYINVLSIKNFNQSINQSIMSPVNSSEGDMRFLRDTDEMQAITKPPRWNHSLLTSKRRDFKRRAAFSECSVSCSPPVERHHKQTQWTELGAAPC